MQSGFLDPPADFEAASPGSGSAAGWPAARSDGKNRSLSAAQDKNEKAHELQTILCNSTDSPVTPKKDEIRYLNEEPGSDQGQTAVLAVKAVMICIEGKVIQIKESEKQHKRAFRCDNRYRGINHKNNPSELPFCSFSTLGAHTDMEPHK